MSSSEITDVRNVSVGMRVKFNKRVVWDEGMVIDWSYPGNTLTVWDGIDCALKTVQAADAELAGWNIDEVAHLRAANEQLRQALEVAQRADREETGILDQEGKMIRVGDIVDSRAGRSAPYLRRVVRCSDRPAIEFAPSSGEMLCAGNSNYLRIVGSQTQTPSLWNELASPSPDTPGKS